MQNETDISPLRKKGTTVANHADALLLSKKGSVTAHAALAYQLQLPGCRGTLRAETDGFLRFAHRLPGTSDEQAYWGIVDPIMPGRVWETRILDTRPYEGSEEETIEAAERVRSRPLLPLLDETGRVVQAIHRGRLNWPVGVDSARPGNCVGLVCGAENLLAAGRFWDECSNLSFVCMLAPDPIATEALQYFAGREVIMADMGDPATTDGYAMWRDQLLRVASGIRNVKVEGWSYADGRPARCLWDLDRIHCEAARNALKERQRARDKQAQARAAT